MAERNATAQRKTAMLNELRAARRYGQGVGRAALSQRELSARYGLSARTVSLALRQLVEEGVLYTVPRVGTFLGHPQYEATEPYLMVRPDTPSSTFIGLMQSGFEVRLGQLGSASLALTAEDAQWHREQHSLPSLAGVFEINAISHSEVFSHPGLPCVGFGASSVKLPYGDRVNFDNFEGGSQATRHLLQMGHRNIAFLSLHRESETGGLFSWSAQREAGWERAMKDAGLETAGLAFYPTTTDHTNSDQQALAAQQISHHLLNNPNITAVIAVNSFAARGLLLALRQSDWPAPKWPAIVCFDTPESSDSVLSCLQLPWDKVGAEAAQLLWERKNGQLVGPTVHRLVGMRLIPRLTCRADWAASSLAHSRAIKDGMIQTTRRAVLEAAGV